MKFIRTLTLVIFCMMNLHSIHAQNSAPEGIYYQAIARDDQGSELVSTALSIQISIREDDTIIYTESHTTDSDQFGLFELVIGNGTPETTLSFDEITWQDAEYFLVVAMDFGDGFETLSETQLLSVPFSLYSTTALNVINDDVTDADADPTNELITDFEILEDSLKLTESGVIRSVALADLAEDGDWVLGTNDSMTSNSDINRVGILEATPTSTLDVNGSLAVGVRNTGLESFDISIEASVDESVILVNVTNGGVTLNLPDAELCEGRIYYIKKYADSNLNSSPNPLTIQPASDQTIDLQPFRTLSSLAFQELTIVSDGANWYILSRSGFE